MIITPIAESVQINAAAASMIFSDLYRENCELKNENNLLRTAYRRQAELTTHFQMHSYDQRFELNYLRELRMHPRLKSTQKNVFAAVWSYIRHAAVNRQGFIHISFMNVARECAVSEKTVSKAINELVAYGAFYRDDEYERTIRNGQSVKIDHVLLMIPDAITTSPLNIQVPDELWKPQGGGNDRCSNPDCGSHRVQRIYHTVCLDCGHEDVRRPITDADRELLDELEEEVLLQLPELLGTSDQAEATSSIKQESFPSDQVGPEASAPLQSIILMQPNEEVSEDELTAEIEEALAPADVPALADQVGRETSYTCIAHEAPMKTKLVGTMEVIFCPECEPENQLDRHNIRR